MPVWHSGLTKQLSDDIERVQIIAVSFILGDKDSRHSDLFQLEKDGSHNTWIREDIFREYICRKTRFYTSPLPFLTRTLNQ